MFGDPNGSACLCESRAVRQLAQGVPPQVGASEPAVLRWRFSRQIGAESAAILAGVDSTSAMQGVFALSPAAARYAWEARRKGAELLS